MAGEPGPRKGAAGWWWRGISRLWFEAPPEAAPITPAGEMTLTSGGGWVIDSKLQSIDFWVISYDCSLLLVFPSLL